MTLNAPAPPRTQPRGPEWLHQLLGGSTAALWVCTAAGFFGAYAWWLDLFDHFRVQGAIAGIVLTLVALIVRKRAVAVTALVPALLNVGVMAPAYGDAAPTGDAPLLEALVFNVHSSGDPDAVARLLATHGDVDVVGLLEITPRWQAPLDEALAPWPHRLYHPRDDNFGLLLASRWPLQGTSEVKDVLGLPIIAATLKPPDAEAVDFVLVHPPPPMSARGTQVRDESLRAYAKLHRQSRDGVLAGDFNTSLWSRALAPLSQAGYRPVRRDEGARGTWPAHYGPFAIGIDHAFARGHLTATGFEVLESAGSDHRPIRFGVGRASP